MRLSFRYETSAGVWEECEQTGLLTDAGNRAGQYDDAYHSTTVFMAAMAVHLLDTHCDAVPSGHVWY